MLIVNKWHKFLGMTKHDKKWHKQDMADELAEYYEETKLINKWSELSDVVYTCSRAKWSGHNLKFPFSNFKYALGLIYMFPKYTGRWLFFRSAGKKAQSTKQLHEVRNPKKVHKLHHIANKYDIDPELFQGICEKQLKHWVLLP